MNVKTGKDNKKAGRKKKTLKRVTKKAPEFKEGKRDMKEWRKKNKVKKIAALRCGKKVKNRRVHRYIIMKEGGKCRN